MTYTTKARPRRKLSAALGLATASALIVLPSSAVAAGSGGVDTTGSDAPPAGSRAKLVNGQAIPPADAPPEVVAAIEAANRIVKGKGYCLGGGHQKWNSRCYDCSGTVSYALGKKGAGVLKSPMPSGSFMRWEQRGKGSWITTYANPGHMYAVIAGLRLDTSSVPGKGPGWSKKLKTSNGPFKKRHPAGF
ncbi:MAG: hypothetical protein ACRDK9_11065 [Solirubrobacterales bacterium]